MSDEKFLDLLHAHPELWRAFAIMLDAFADGCDEEEAKRRAYPALPAEIRKKLIPAG